MKIGMFTILFFMFGLFFMGFIIDIVWSDNETKKIDCFDRHGNKILNQVCLDEPSTNGEKIASVGLGFVFLMLLTFLGLLVDLPIPRLRL